MRNFKPSEFRRVGCDIADCDCESLRKLDLMRDLAGVPIVITSAFRTPERNSAVGGVSNSAHLRGKAFDLRCSSSLERKKLVIAAFEAGFVRVGISKLFIHVDDDISLPHPIIFLY